MTPDPKPPNPRLERLRRKFAELPPLSPGARLVLLVLGWLLVLIGIAGLVLPGLQGILTLLLGGALLSLVSPRILAVLRWLFRPWPRGWRRLLRWRQRAHRWIYTKLHRGDGEGDEPRDGGA